MVLAQYLSRLPEALAASTAFRVLPGARELVAQLSRRQGVTLALATGNVLPGARIKLAKAQLNRFFVSGAYGGDAPTRAGIVHTALTRVARRLNASLQLERCFLIGDTVKDVASALENRIVPIAVCTGTDDRTTLFAAGAHIVLDSLEQAQAVVRLL
jgi:phosphoglycolate phosphatase-like HAD superfamily hydrolase